MRHTTTFVMILAGLAFLMVSMPAAAQVRPQQAEQIRKAAPDKPRVAPKKPRTVLIWNTPPALMDKDPHKGYCIPFGQCAMETLGEKTGAFTPVISGDLAMYLPESLKRFDAIVMNNSSGPWIRPTDEDLERMKAYGQDKDAVEQLLRKSLLDYVKAGGGIVACHFAIGANSQWPEFQEMLGGKFIGHPWNEEVGIKLDEPAHPLLAVFGGKDFRLADEIYEFGDPYSREKLRVLLSLDTKKTNMNVPWIHRKDGDFAQAWVKPYGKGRIFYCGFGHRTEIWWNPTVLAFYLDAIQFATGDLEAPMTPRSGNSTGGAQRQAGSPPEGFVSLFDGKTLDGWTGDRRIWSVRDGTITGRTTPESRLRENNFLVWKDEVEDFELRLKFRLEGGNSGVYYRARRRPADQTEGDPLVGTQADFDATGRWTGVIMEYLLRDVLAERGQKVLIDETGKRQVLGAVGDPKKLLKAVQPKDWNDYAVIAQGGRVVLKINGVTMCELDDRDPRRIKRGLLALQVHAGPPMLVQFKDIYLRKL
jgi:type 1 glutamine amidotransferase